MHPFSIDFITRREDETCKGLYDVSTFDRNTPSPSDSGLDSSSTSPSSNMDSPTGVENESLSKVMLTLNKTLQANKEKTGDEKPAHSYIALISIAILSTPEKRMLLSDIYKYIMDNYPYYNNAKRAWRNSIRHNLSLNECFIKNGRANNGKGNKWAIHPACETDFAQGDYRRRQARRRARKSMKDSACADTSALQRSNIGYVPMTPSAVGYHPYGHARYYQPTRGLDSPVSQGGQADLYPGSYPALVSSHANMISGGHNFDQQSLVSSVHLTSHQVSSANQTFDFPHKASLRLPSYSTLQGW